MNRHRDQCEEEDGEEIAEDGEEMTEYGEEEMAEDGEEEMAEEEMGEEEFLDGDLTDSDVSSDLEYDEDPGDEEDEQDEIDDDKEDYWLPPNVKGLPEKEKSPPVFVQTLWNAAIAQAEFRVRAHRQLCLEDVPRFRIYIDTVNEKSFIKLMIRIFRRMRKIRSMSLYGTPTTPQIEGFETFHIIEFVKVDKNGVLHIVETLHRESNLYFGAIQKTIGGSVVKPGWLIFDKKPLPKWIIGTKIPYSDAHGKIYGVLLGKFWWEDIFYNLFNCQEDSKNDKEVDRVLKRFILLLCEPQRFRTLQRRVERTLKDETMEEIEEDKEIHSWGYLSREGFNFELAELGAKPAPKPKDHYAETIRKKISMKWQIFGAHGEIMILKYDEMCVIPIIMKHQEELASKAANWKPQKHVLDTIANLLDGQFDNMTDQALAGIRAQYKNLQDFHSYLVYILVHKQGQSLPVKQAAGLLLEKEVRTAFWDISPSCVQYIKSALLPCIGTRNKELRFAATKLIAALFQWFHVACWMELFQELHESMDSNDFDRNEGSMEVLLKISENGAEHLHDAVLGLDVRPINVFMPLLMQFIKSPHANLRKLALGCISQYMVIMPSSLTVQLDQYIEHLLELFEDPSEHVQEKVCGAWVQIVSVDPSTLEKKLSQMGNEAEKHREAAVSSIVAIVAGHIMRSNVSQILTFLLAPLDDQFPVIRSTTCQTISGCSKSVIQNLGHPNGGDLFVEILMVLLCKTSHSNAGVRDAAKYALQALEEEVENQDVDTEARQALVHYIELHGAKGWKLLMSTLKRAT